MPAGVVFSKFLQYYPDDKEAYFFAAGIYHDKLFKFDEAFALNRQWLERHPNDLAARAGFAEKHFTVGLFPQCEQRITTLLNKPEIPVSVKTALRAIEIASFLASGQARQVPARLDMLIMEVSQQPATFKTTWSFSGVKHLIGQNPTLSPYHALLRQLFTALEAQDRDTSLRA